MMFTFAGLRINIQGNVGFEYQVCICTKAEENHGNLLESASRRSF